MAEAGSVSSGGAYPHTYSSDGNTAAAGANFVNQTNQIARANGTNNASASPKKLSDEEKQQAILRDNGVKNAVPLYTTLDGSAVIYKDKNTGQLGWTKVTAQENKNYVTPSDRFNHLWTEPDGRVQVKSEAQTYLRKIGYDYGQLTNGLNTKQTNIFDSIVKSLYDFAKENDPNKSVTYGNTRSFIEKLPQEIKKLHQ